MKNYLKQAYEKSLLWRLVLFVPRKLYHFYYFLQRLYRLYILSDKALIKTRFKENHGYLPNLSEPSSFNEKLQWLKLYDKEPLQTLCADKYKVRDYVKAKIGEAYLVPLLGIIENPRNLDFSALPEQFVIKMNHASGLNRIVYDKAKLNKAEFMHTLKSWFGFNYYRHGREWQYKSIKRLAVIEALLLDKKGNVPNDYKFFCFRNHPKKTLIQVDLDRFTDHRRVFFDKEWNLQDFGLRYEPKAISLEKPKNFEKMLELAHSLSQDFVFVRVDFYNLEGKIYFGELTFHPEGGFGKFSPASYDRVLGSWLDLPDSGSSKGLSS